MQTKRTSLILPQTSAAIWLGPAHMSMIAQYCWTEPRSPWSRDAKRRLFRLAFACITWSVSQTMSSAVGAWLENEASWAVWSVERTRWNSLNAISSSLWDLSRWAGRKWLFELGTLTFYDGCHGRSRDGFLAQKCGRYPGRCGFMLIPTEWRVI